MCVRKTTKEKNTYIPYEPGLGTYSVALILGSGASFALATCWLDFSPGWLALLVGAFCALVGTFLCENIGDAIMFSLILGVMVSVLVNFGPQIATVRTAIVPIATGLCVGKLVAGISKETST